ncbi:hypothetical protein LPJ63_002180 [Coemansia sp. RSA 2711]|nr:hypothetical protein LPJ63_002180 [Coemansia sp. RSA 2711]KAJ1844052.1 hypothetical protein LPJ70_003127 [Coemansia sp. RSA 2708]KAJ2307798.1 hypothetical protein IWW54_004276 [Coemansia sp. RSA 2705]KAJ2316534.1 hypothetical protein IWW52_003600 [Coemansia sp. RSA 2704]KAJ2317854.1 hypothetical protein IWW51_005262 [Coemansia sp. RSA 2702]KAJ2389889.1 hypothetical protein H4S02_002140 [Coemansia sp. RSA 2611]KAJ2729134.1 hypothetical protein H4R23_003528 [Coemansia sp. Cherry 401B]
MLRCGLLSQRLSSLRTLLKPQLPACRNFSQTLCARDSQAYIVPQVQFETPLTKPEEKRPNVMKVIEREAMARANVDGRGALFVRRAAPKDRLCAGDVVMVETLNSMSDTSVSTFSGVCIAIYRRGIDTSFILRNIVQKVGVEMRFMAYSPLVKNIKILQKAKRFNRAKLFYLRENPGKTFRLKALKTMERSVASSKKQK